MIKSKDLFNWEKDWSYVECKFTRPHILLHDGTILRYCFPNAGIFNGYDSKNEIQKVSMSEVEAVQYNNTFEYHKWRKTL